MLAKLTSWTGTEYRSAKHTALIASRLRDGYTELELRAVIGYCADKTGLGWGDPEHKCHKFLRPQTLFGPETIQRYVDEARTWVRKYYPDVVEEMRPRLVEVT